MTKNRVKYGKIERYFYEFDKFILKGEKWYICIWGLFFVVFYEKKCCYLNIKFKERDISL